MRCDRHWPSERSFLGHVMTVMTIKTALPVLKMKRGWVRVRS